MNKTFYTNVSVKDAYLSKILQKSMHNYTIHFALGLGIQFLGKPVLFFTCTLCYMYRVIINHSTFSNNIQLK